MLNLIAATQAEADPVISALKLKKDSSLLNCYQNQDTQLVISGIGKCNAAIACGWLAQKTFPTDIANKPSIAWLNFGIAGHPEADLGTALIAHKVTDKTTEHVWYPHRMTSDIQSSDLITVDKPLNTYEPGKLHDMEASAYLQAARKFSDAELVQVVKVVSDNQTQPLSAVNAKMATRLIEARIDEILHCIDTLKTLGNAISTPDNTISEAFQDRWRFSVSQTVQLERLLQRHTVLLGTLTNIPESLQSLPSSKNVLSLLKKKIDSADITL